MDCEEIGLANPDIAGTGILVAFIIQSLIAVFVSGYTWILSSTIQKRWNEADVGVEGAGPEETEDPITRFLRTLGVKWGSRLESFSIIRLRRRVHDSIMNLLSLSSVVSRFLRKLMVNDRTAPKVWVWPEWLVGKQPEEKRKRNPGSTIDDEITATTRRLDCAEKILLAGSDSQTFTGIALLISALIQVKTLSFYHLHIIYDTASLVVISNCAASVSIFQDGLVKGFTRLVLIFLWGVLFFAYVIVFGTRLRKWDYDLPSHCYKTTITALPHASHPYVDNIYIAITCLFIASTFGYAINLALDSAQKAIHKRHQARATKSPFPGRSRSNILNTVKTTGTLQLMLEVSLQLQFGSAVLPATDMQYAILMIAMAQCPLHIYSIFALRASNERFLTDGSTEQDWGFGQIAAVVLLGGNILQFVDGISEYRKTAQLDTATMARNIDEEQERENANIAEETPKLATQDAVSLVKEENVGETIQPVMAE